jgi:hypothetical protein
VKNLKVSAAIRGLVATLSAILFSAVAGFSQGASQTVRVGYAVVTPASPISTGLVVFETFVQTRILDTLEVGVLPTSLITNALVPVEVSRSLLKTLGIAVENPFNSAASVTMTLRTAAGAQFAAGTITVPAHQQISKMVTELFAAVPSEFTGTMVISSTSPVSIIGLAFRGQNYSTIPLTDLAPTSILIPAISFSVGGLGASLFPQFVTGGGWATEVSIVNTTAGNLTVRLDLFAQDGTPLTVNLNSQTSSSFTNLVVPANGLLIVAP